MSIANKEIAFAAFLDIEGDFDNTPFDSIVSVAFEQITDMLEYRPIQADLRGKSLTVQAARGCLQVGVLSLLL